MSRSRPALIAIALSALVASCEGARSPAPSTASTATVDRCGPGVRGDAEVAAALSITEERLARLKAERSLDNDDLCTIPTSLVARAQRRVDKPKPEAPGEWVKWLERTLQDDSGTIKPDGLIEALAQRKAAIARTSAALAAGKVPALAGLDATRWTSLGPANIPGRVRAIVIHPTDGNRIWVGSVSGGIWYTSDGGTTWRALNDFQSNLAIAHLAMDPSNTSILYAGTGEGFLNGGAVRGAGIFRSTDSGQTWIQMSSTNPASDSNWYYVNRIAVNPSNSSLILAATNGGIYRTADGGTSWTQITQSRTLDVRWDPTSASRAIGGRDDGNVSVSTDSGASFSTVAVVSGGARVELAFSATSSGTVYASVQSGTGAVYRSTDGGASWSLRSSPTHLGSQGWYNNTIWVDPTNANTVVVGGIDIWRSTDGGASFTRISNWALWPSSVHADNHVIVSHPSYNGSSNAIVFVGNDGGVAKSSNILSATSASSSNTWSLISTGKYSTQFYGGASSADGTKIAGGTQDNGSLYTSSSNTTWGVSIGGDGGYEAIDQTDSNYVYGELQYGAIHRSTEGGANAATICEGLTDAYDSACTGGTNNTNFIPPFILDPNNQSKLLFGGNRLWITDNAKAATPTWRIAKSATAESGNHISAVAVARSSSDIIWVGHNNGEVYKTANGTATTPTWTAVTIGPARQVLRILLDPSNSNTVYASFAGYSAGNLRKSTDGGTTWTDISTGLPAAPIRGIARHPSNANWLYVGTEVGVYTSEDGGSTWSTTNDGPGTVPVYDVFFAGTTTDLIAATHGRGMFRASVASTSTTATPETGWWWASTESGRGFSLEVNGNNIFMSSYLYSTNGKPIWYISLGARSSNGVYQGTLLQYGSGQTLSGAYQAATQLGSVGSVTLSFDTTTSGRLTWAGGTVSIQRYNIITDGVTSGPAAGMPQKGWWWNSAEGGRGYFMEVQGSTMFLAAYMYDSAGQAVWYISQGTMTSTSLFTGTLTQFNGGQTLGGPYIAPTSSSNVGTVTVQFSSQTAATMTLPNGQQIALTRFSF